MTGTPTSRGTRPELPAVGSFLLLGVLAGVAAKVADESGWRWAADLGSYPAAWVLAVALIARSAPSVATAAIRSAVFFAAMTVAYYTWAAAVLGFGWNSLLPVWLVLSGTAVAVFAAAVRWADRRTGLGPGAVIAGAAGLPIAGGEFADLWHAAVGTPAGSGRLDPVQAAVDAVVAVVLVVVLPCSSRTRLWAVAFLVPATVVAGTLLHVLRTVTG
ncbi:hypothetical protein [Blastococcus goldschmidtiae]|uniref:Uncharacterized protein n=1 Tax=Blastococcus goldschmidtiae TaxID=3075546 RepID=A0ABU2K980_9ACTN|nr:hypothetical protein [Blastococcus sp. DSM 46792]MDT0276742.1 hypothetical protein [Blastococcus sp. DSM 46792]